MMLLIFLLSAMFSPTAEAQASGSVTWQRYDVTVDIREDGTVHVTESIDVRFGGSFSKGKRSIPMNRIEGIANVSVAAAAEGDTPVPTTFRTSESDGDFVIDYEFEPVRRGDVRTILLEYDARGVIRDYPDNDPPRQEIRWTAISDEVTAIGSVRAASATITFPASVEGSAATRFDPAPDTSTATSVTWTMRNMGEGSALKTFASFPAMTEATKPAWQDAADGAAPITALLPSPASADCDEIASYLHLINGLLPESDIDLAAVLLKDPTALRPSQQREVARIFDGWATSIEVLPAVEVPVSMVHYHAALIELLDLLAGAFSALGLGNHVTYYLLEDKTAIAAANFTAAEEWVQEACGFTPSTLGKLR